MHIYFSTLSQFLLEYMVVLHDPIQITPIIIINTQSFSLVDYPKYVSFFKLQFGSLRSITLSRASSTLPKPFLSGRLGCNLENSTLHVESLCQMEAPFMLSGMELSLSLSVVS